LFSRFDDLKSFHGFGIAAELKGELAEAKRLSDELRRIAVAIAAPVYEQVALGNRMTSSSFQSRRLMIEALDRELASIDISADDNARVRKTYVHSCKFDLANAFDEAVSDYLRSEEVRVSQALSSYKQPVVQGDPDHQKLVDDRLRAMNSLAEIKDVTGWNADISSYNLRRFWKSSFMRVNVSSEYASRMDRLLEFVTSEIDEVDRGGNLSPNAAKFLDLLRQKGKPRDVIGTFENFGQVRGH